MKETYTEIINYITSREFLSIVIIAFASYFTYRILLRISKKMIRKSKFNPSLQVFMISCIRVLGLMLVFITVATSMGVPMDSFLVILSTFGLAASLSVKDSLSNLISGVQMLLSKPYAAGDFIEFTGLSGYILNVDLLYTKIETIDSKIIFVPNGTLSKATITNCSSTENRLYTASLNIAQTADLTLAKSIIGDVIGNNGLILADPAPAVAVTGYTAAAVILTVNVWSTSDNYLTLTRTLIEEIFVALKEKEVPLA